MRRVVNTSSFPAFPSSVDGGTEVIALGSSVPRDASVPFRSLKSIALEVVQANRLKVASPVQSRQILKRSIYRVAPNSDISSLESRMKRILKIVLRTGIDPELLLKKGSPRVRLLGLIAIEYKKAIRRIGLIDNSELLLTASGLANKRRKFLVYGYFRARKEEILLIDAVAGDGSVYYLPTGKDPMFDVNRQAVNELIDQGWTPSQDNETPKVIGREAAAAFIGNTNKASLLTARAFPDIDMEVRSTLSTIKGLIRNGADQTRIAVVARDMAKYARPISVVADEYGLPVQLDHLIPLVTTGFGGFVATLLEAIDGDLAFEPTARLVMHPFGPGLGECRISDARRQRITGAEKWSAFCPSLAGLEEKGEKGLSRWVEDLRSKLDELGTRKRAVGSAAEWTAYQTFFEALETTAALEQDRPINFEAFSSIVNEILTEESVPMRPRRGGVAVFLPENLVGAAFDHVFIIGLAEGILPRAPREDPVIDFYERRILRAEHDIRFASAADVAHWEELSFYFALLSAQKNIVVSYPRVIDNAEMVPSSFFQRLGIDAEKLLVARDPESISSVEEARRFMLRTPVLAFDEGLESARHHYRAEYARETRPYYDEFDGVIGVPHDPAKRTWSASQITTIGQCSFRWFAGRLLHLSAVEEMKTGLDGGTRGKLYHKALEIAVSRSIGSSDIRAATLANLEDAFADAEKDERVNLPLLPNWDLERREQMRELRKAVEAGDFILPDAEVVGVEKEFRAEWRGFPLRGVIDRVDSTPYGLIAIDYKTSGQMPKGAKDATGRLSVDVQIPLYSQVALPTLFPGQSVGTSIYYSLTKRKILREEQEADMQRLVELSDRLHEILAAGSFAVDPDAQEKACTYCDFETVCRKGPRLRRKSRCP